ncbi:hypothetical protein [Bradyrhizobium sp. LVM 105]|uniref:hypothetical protein n=1 Tax=Bradyrhizobium sp. LVM 105 TaxID=2341115 RepID=UPI000F7FEB4F|nr:hypothetical protein [Bradyrhizobium sp. LVM 105]RTE91878.1 hypothetical protein D6B98_15785 [Bradyrhizobium sp. LVM 105]
MRDYDEYEPEAEEMMDSAKPTGDGIKVEINQYAMERIEAACMAGVRQEISRKIETIIEENIREIVEERLQSVVGKLAEESILKYLTEPRPRTNSWGEKVSGTPMTISDQIPDKVAGYLAEHVDRDGRPDRSYGKVTRLDWIISKFVTTELEVATKTAANQVSEQAKKVVAAHVGRFVAEQMIPQIDVSKTAA